MKRISVTYVERELRRGSIEVDDDFDPSDHTAVRELLFDREGQFDSEGIDYDYDVRTVEPDEDKD